MKEFTPFSFDAYLKNPIADNLFVIYGEERFFFEPVVKKIEKAVFSNPAERDLNYNIFYGSESSAPQIINACLSFPMMAKMKLIVVREFDTLEIPDPDSFIKYLKKPQTASILVLLAEELGRGGFYNEILSLAVKVVCKRLYERDVYKWVQQRLDDNELKTSKESIAFLIENIGLNLMRLNLEIEKISNYLGPGQLLTLEHVSQITGFSRDVNIFNFQKVLAARDLKSSLNIGSHLLEQGNFLVAILPALFTFFRRFWLVKELLEKHQSHQQIINELGGNPYAYKDIFANHENFTPSHLKLILDKLLEADIQLKSSQKKSESILTILCYFICNFEKNSIFLGTK
jgi:DNA polymerase-3 subunit delta